MAVEEIKYQFSFHSAVDVLRRAFYERDPVPTDEEVDAALDYLGQPVTYTVDGYDDNPDVQVSDE